MLFYTIYFLNVYIYTVVVNSQRYVPKHLYNPLLQVRLSQGTVQGKIKETIHSQVPYYSFEGIPYAAAPTGSRRFKSPEPAKSWTGVLNGAQQTVPACIQIIPSIFNDGLTESEDCLYINIFTNSLNTSEVMPVMVWIHGGGFLMGLPNSSYYGPDYLLEQNVVVVHFGYRLNSFGFLSTGDLEAPGNFGLKDQRLALRWVKDNIKYFGGNPERITIFGESAGGASVQYHLMNVKNEGLFQGAISQSGSALCIWAFQRNPRDIAFDLGFLAGIRTNDSKELITYLRRISASKLKMVTLAIILRYTVVGIANGIAFAPSLEPEHEDAFFTQQAHQAMSQRNVLSVPYLLGFNSKEAFYAQPGFDFSHRFLERWDTDPRMLVPIDMNLEGGDVWPVGQAIKKFYMDNSSIPKSEQYLEYINDGYFLRPITESARLFSNVTDTFLYRFSYEGYYLGKKALGYEENDVGRGVYHTEEMWYIFSRGDLLFASDTDKNIRMKMVKMWTNFAKYGQPTPFEDDPDLDNITWPKIEDNMLTHVDINRKLSVKDDFEEDGVKFWRKLYETHGNPPFDTY